MLKNIDIVPWRNTRTIYDGGEMDPAETTGSSGGGSGSSGSSGGSGSLGGRGGITDWSGGSTGGGSSNGNNYTALPGYALLASKFKVVAQLTAEQVCKMIGGKVWYNYQNDPAYKNACAIRLSYALNQSGHKVPFSSGKTSSGDDGSWYYYRVSDLKDYLTNTYGPPTKTTESAIQGKQGIILRTECGWGDSSGHLDVWDGSKSLNKDYPDCKDIYFWKY